MKTRFEEAVATGVICPEMFAEWIPYRERMNHINRCGKNGEYRDSYLQGPWLVWKTAWSDSRAELCVDLPRCTNESQDEYFRELVDELETLGVNYK